MVKVDEPAAQEIPVQQREIEAAKDIKKKDISSAGARKLEKMRALQGMSSNGVINLTVNEYK